MDKFEKLLIVGIFSIFGLLGFAYYQNEIKHPHYANAKNQADIEYVKAVTMSDSHLTIDGIRLYVVKLDGCLYYTTAGCGVLTHVGNCPNHGYVGKPPKTP